MSDLWREVCGCPDHGCDGPMPEGAIPTQTGWMVPVEPDRYLSFNDKARQRAMGNLGLPDGRYAIVRLDDE